MSAPDRDPWGTGLTVDMEAGAAEIHNAIGAHLGKARGVLFTLLAEDQYTRVPEWELAATLSAVEDTVKVAELLLQRHWSLTHAKRPSG